MTKIYTLEIEAGSCVYDDLEYWIEDIKPTYDLALTSLLTYIASAKQQPTEEQTMLLHPLEDLIDNPEMEETPGGVFVGHMHRGFSNGIATIREWNVAFDEDLKEMILSKLSTKEQEYSNAAGSDALYNSGYREALEWVLKELL